MNVLLLSQFFSTTKGGGEYLFNIIAKNLAENNHKVWVITNRITNESYDVHKNVKLIFVPPNLDYKGGLPPGFLDNIRYFFHGLIAGLKIIKKEKIDIIHSNNFSPALTGAVLSSFTSKPHITAIWDIFSLCGEDYWQKWTRQAGVSKIHRFLGPRFEKLILKLPHSAIQTISEASKEDLIKFGATKPIHVILPAIEKIESRKRISNFKQFVYVGRLVFYKNLEVVIKAIKIVRKTDPMVRLVVIGGGPNKRSLENLTKNLGLESNVKFIGYVTSDEKMCSIADSIAMVFPSLCEGFGLVILEAFSQNKPVLVSNIRPMSDIISHGQTGYVLDPHDENLWAEYLLKILTDSREAKIMGQNGHRLLGKFSEESLYKQIIEMYEEVLTKD
ncbi:MAG TPA: glycosyltransferase family 4 protein [Nitrosopumilaceae archaeon]|nr:glycosyltransferase family 4 protein [Nitrosopumilaceae archaeon]